MDRDEHAIKHDEPPNNTLHSDPDDMIAAICLNNGATTRAANTGTSQAVKESLQTRRKRESLKGWDADMLHQKSQITK